MRLHTRWEGGDGEDKTAIWRDRSDLPVVVLYMTMESSVHAAPMMQSPVWSRQKSSRRPGMCLGMVRKTERDAMSHTMTSEVKRRPM